MIFFFNKIIFDHLFILTELGSWFTSWSLLHPWIINFLLSSLSPYKIQIAKLKDEVFILEARTTETIVKGSTKENQCLNPHVKTGSPIVYTSFLVSSELSCA